MKLVTVVWTWLLVGAAAASFYDNPEQDPIPEGGSSIEELEKKWAFEVQASPTFSQHIYIADSLLVMVAVGILGHIDFCPSEACEMPDCTI